MKTETETQKVEVLRAPDGKFLPGTGGNPLGRPRGTSFMDTFKLALKEVEKEKRKSLLRHFIEQAYVDNRVLIAAIDRILPALQSIAFAGVVGPLMTDEECESIRETLKTRFGK